MSGGSDISGATGGAGRECEARWGRPGLILYHSLDARPAETRIYTNHNKQWDKQPLVISASSGVFVVVTLAVWPVHRLLAGSGKTKNLSNVKLSV